MGDYIYIRYKDNLLRIKKHEGLGVKVQAIGDLPFQTQAEDTYVCDPQKGLGFRDKEGNFAPDSHSLTLEAPPKDIAEREANWTQNRGQRWKFGDDVVQEEVIKDYFKNQILVSSLCSRKYDKLSVYFGELTLTDISSLDEEELVDAVKQEERILMRSFYRNELQRESMPATVDSSIKIKEEPVQPTASGVERRDKRIALNLRGKVYSDKFKSLVSSESGRIVASSMVEFVEKLSPLFGLDIDLSDCQLLDADIPYVEQVFNYFKNSTRLDLSGNRFYGKHTTDVDESLKRMLKKPGVEYINIVRNPLASTDRKSFFEELEKEQLLNKLIWIPENWLSDGAWKGVVSPNVVELVLKVHSKYYSE